VPVQAQVIEAEYGLLGFDALGEFVFVVDGPGRRLLIEVRDMSPR